MEILLGTVLIALVIYSFRKWPKREDKEPCEDCGGGGPPIEF